jgi:LacI family transcriptional regulator
MEKVTINVVAEQAGVSKKTVSRVLNDEPNVSEETRLKVLEVSKALGYKPNPLARGLASNRSYILGLLYDNPNTNYVTNIQTGALKICQQRGYHLLIHPCQSRNEAMLASVEELINHSRLDGLVLTPPFSDIPELLEYLESKQLHFIRIGATLALERSSTVISNDIQASYEMTRYLISLGHRRIGFIKGHPQHNASAQRFQGYQKALVEAHIQLEDELIKQGDFTFASGEECARQLLPGTNRPTAIFASNDYMAAGIMKVASQFKISIPHELSVTGFDNAPISQYIWPSISTIKQPVEEMAAKAVSVLLEQIAQPENDFSTAVLDSTLVVRESTSPVRN